MDNQRKFDQLCRDVAEIKANQRFGEAGKFSDGRLAGEIRALRREVQAILVLFRPGATGKYHDGRLASALRRLLRSNNLGDL